MAQTKKTDRKDGPAEKRDKSAPVSRHRKASPITTTRNAERRRKARALRASPERRAVRRLRLVELTLAKLGQAQLTPSMTRDFALRPFNKLKRSVQRCARRIKAYDLAVGGPL